MNEIKVESIMQYLVDGESVEENRFYDLLDEAIRNSSEDMYDEALDEEGDICLGSCSYSRSQVWKAIDYTAYSCGFDDFVNGLFDDAMCDLEHGRTVTYDHSDFEIMGADLPTEIDIDFDEVVNNTEDCSMSDLEEGINELLSNEYGFCFSNYDLKIDRESKVAHVSNIEWTLD